MNKDVSVSVRELQEMFSDALRREAVMYLLLSYFISKLPKHTISMNIEEMEKVKPMQFRCNVGPTGFIAWLEEPPKPDQPIAINAKEDI